MFSFIVPGKVDNYFEEDTSNPPTSKLNLKNNIHGGVKRYSYKISINSFEPHPPPELGVSDSLLKTLNTSKLNLPEEVS